MRFLDMISAGGGASGPDRDMVVGINGNRRSLPGNPFNCQLKEALHGRDKRGIMTSQSKRQEVVPGWLETMISWLFFNPFTG